MCPALKKLPVRLNIAVMIFFGCWVNYMTRVNISVIIIAMVPQNTTASSMKGECMTKNNYNLSYFEDKQIFGSFGSRRFREKEGLVTFDWTAQQQAYVLSSYFYGYAITCLLGSRLVELLGPRLLIFVTMFLCAILNSLSPQAARLHYSALVAVRFIIGLSAGFTLPAMHDLVARWAPPGEKNKFVSVVLGGSIGTVFTWSLSGPLIEAFGWDYAFYIPGLAIMAWCVVWWFLVYDSPLEHPRISDYEKQYIVNAIGNKVEQTSKKRAPPPYKSILMSFPFLSMVVLHYGNGWGVYFIMTAAPKYVSSALGFNISSTGTLASLPYLARMIFCLIFGAIGDKIVKTNVVSVTFIRKFFTLFSHIIPGLLLIVLGYTGCSPIISVALITFSLGINGSATLTNLINHQDLAPNFAATLFAIANGIGNTAGFLTPLVTAHFTKNGNGLAEWRPVLLTGGSVYITTALYFILFGSGETQPWNYTKPASDSKRNEGTSVESLNLTVMLPGKI